MEAAEQTNAQWFDRNQHHLINCPLQPGQLRITDRACARRYQLAQGITDARQPESAFLFAVHMNLLRCRDCPVGRAKLSAPRA